MNPTKQIEKLQGHARLFSEQVRSLIQTFEMLRPVAEDAELLKRYSGTDRARGLTVIRWSMIQECLIEIPKLVFDDRPNNPTAHNLISGLLAPESEKVREALKAKFVLPVPVATIPGREQTEVDLAFQKEIEAREAKNREADFESYQKELCQGRFWFEHRKDEFKRIRDKQLAHLDTSKIGSDYVITPVAGPDWKTLKEAVGRLIELAELLLSLLYQPDESFEQFCKLAKRDADLFWQ